MFGQLGDMASLLKKAGEMKTQMARMKEELSSLEITGTSSGDYVRTVISGDLSRVIRVEINPVCLAKENQAALEAAVRESFQNALAAAAEESRKRLSEAAGGLNLPGLI